MTGELLSRGAAVCCLLTRWRLVGVNCSCFVSWPHPNVTGQLNVYSVALLNLLHQEQKVDLLMRGQSWIIFCISGLLESHVVLVKTHSTSFSFVLDCLCSGF